MAALLTFILYTGLGIFIASSYQYIINSAYRKRYQFIILLCIVLGFFSALRGNTGTDTIAYRSIYSGEDISFSRGILYMILNNMFSFIGIPYEIFLFILGFFTALFTFLALLKEKEYIDPFVAALVFFMDLYLYSFNIMRQMLAISICLLAVSLYLRDEKKRALLLFVVAILIHSPAIIYLGIIFIQFMFNKKYYKALAFICIIGVLFFVINRNALFLFMSYLIGNNYHYMHYFNPAYVGNMEIIPYVIKLMPVVIFSGMASSYFKNAKQMRVYFFLAIIGYILGSLDEFYGNEIGRIGYYFSYLRIFLLGFAAKKKLMIGKYKIKQNWEKKAIIFYIISVYIYNIFIAGGGALVPYGAFIS